LTDEVTPCKARDMATASVQISPLGHFRAREVRDGEALKRDGEPFFQIHRLRTKDGRPLFEILFGDGLWMLASEADLERQGIKNN
jgi:hypothetical protein